MYNPIHRTTAHESALKCESESRYRTQIACRTARHDRPRRSPGVSSTLLLWWIQTQVQTDLGFFSPVFAGSPPFRYLAAVQRIQGGLGDINGIF